MRNVKTRIDKACPGDIIYFCYDRLRHSWRKKYEHCDVIALKSIVNSMIERGVHIYVDPCLIIGVEIRDRIDVYVTIMSTKLPIHTVAFYPSREVHLEKLG